MIGESKLPVTTPNNNNLLNHPKYILSRFIIFCLFKTEKINDIIHDY